MYTVTIAIPSKLYEKIRELGIDLEHKIIELLLREFSIDPTERAQIHLELAIHFLEEGRKLIDKDPVQASEKLYKAAEECVKALATYFDVKNVLERVQERGRWTVTELEKAVREISKIVGRWFLDAWDHAWTLHVWGFHEAKLDSEAVRDRLQDVERMVKETMRILRTR